MASESECIAVAEPPHVHLHLHPDGTEPLAHIAVDYCPEACHHASEEGEIHVTYDDRGGARWRSRCRFLPGGAVATTIRAPAGDTAGLNYNLYLSSLEGSRDMDEIDFEFLGHDKCAVQTNFHVAGGGGREQIHVLPFDSSDGFHHYAITWGAEAIEWRIDGELIRREERLAGEPWPEKPMFLYASVWDASHINDGKWTGTYHGRDAPYVCSYRDIRVRSHWKTRKIHTSVQVPEMRLLPLPPPMLRKRWMPEMRLLPPRPPMLRNRWMPEMFLLPPPAPTLWKRWTPELVKIRSLRLYCCSFLSLICGGKYV